MRLGKFNFDEVEKLAMNVEQAIAKEEAEKVMHKVLLAIAVEVLRNTQDRTPQDTGYLVSQWRVGDIMKSGEQLTVEIYNPVEYASFVEHGHRTRWGTGARPPQGPPRWVEGWFMLETSIAEVRSKLPNKAEKLIEDFLKGLVE